MDYFEKGNLMKHIPSLTAYILSALLAIAWHASAMADGVNIEAMVQDNSKFGLELYRKLGVAESGNIFLSPFSVSNTLAIMYAGARGNTKDQMARTLKFSMNQDEVVHAFGTINSRLNQLKASGNIRIDTANSIWPQKGYDIAPQFFELVQRNYGEAIIPIDYGKNPEEARQTINQWIAKKTRETIKDMIPQGSLDQGTRLALASAIHFKGDWLGSFKPEDTSELDFWVTSERSVRSPMMTQTSDFKYAETESLQILEMPYVGNELSMLVVLPKEINGVKMVEDSLSAENLTKLRLQMSPTKVLIHIPKFKVNSTFFLAETLASMGMKDAFSRSKANFSGIAKNKKNPLYLSTVIHKAFAEITEEGTEASASTVGDVVSMGVRPADPPEPPHKFRADHPFIFLIQENKTGSLLFIGKITNPTTGRSENGK
jgi:serpin B